MRLAALNTAVSIGFETLRANPLRTILSTLGVIIGVAALVSVLSLADGMERTARQQLDGTTDVQVMSVSAQVFERIQGEIFPLPDTLVLTREDLASIAALPGVGAAALVRSSRAELQLEGPDRRMASITATVSGYQEIARRRLDSGRYFSSEEVDSLAPVAVISASLARLLVPPGTNPDSVGAAAIGRDVVLGGERRQVIGVLDSDLESPLLEAVVPLDASSLTTTARAQLFVRTARVEEVGAVENAIREHFRARGADPARSIQIGSYRARAEQAAQTFLILRLFMGALTGISLLVGGIGIMNVLLASVTERTREIGIRKATGARHNDILIQFLAESVSVSAAGGVIGIGLGLAISFGVTSLIRALADAPFLQAAISVSTIAVATMAAVLVGLVFGTYPARRAARLSPIDAIRHE